MDEIPEITPDLVGCWLDGAFGWKNDLRVIGLASDHGYEVHTDDRREIEDYERNGHVRPNEWVDEIVAEALDHLNEAAPEGYTFEYIANELVLLPVCQSEGFDERDECAHCPEPESERKRQQQWEELRQQDEETQRHYRTA